MPSTFGIRALVRINSMGATLSDVHYEYVLLWIQVAAYFIATCAVYKYQLDKSHRHAIERVTAVRSAVERQRNKKRGDKQ